MVQQQLLRLHARDPGVIQLWVLSPTKNSTAQEKTLWATMAMLNMAGHTYQKSGALFVQSLAFSPGMFSSLSFLTQGTQVLNNCCDHCPDNGQKPALVFARRNMNGPGAIYAENPSSRAAKTGAGNGCRGSMSNDRMDGLSPSSQLVTCQSLVIFSPGLPTAVEREWESYLAHQLKQNSLQAVNKRLKADRLSWEILQLLLVDGTGLLTILLSAWAKIKAGRGIVVSGTGQRMIRQNN